MKRIFATLTLACAMSVSALAGEIPTCSPAPPAVMTTSEVPTVSSQPVTGEIPTVDSSTATSESEPSVLTDLLLTLVGLIVR